MPGASFLGSLTARGQALLAAGLTALVCGISLAERDLVRIGVFVGAAPLLAALYVRVRRPRLQVERQIDPPQLGVGATTRVLARVTALGDSGPLEVTEKVPYSLGASHRERLAPLREGETATVEYRLRPEVRGRFLLGPMRVRMSDPFGLAELATEVPGRAEVVVTPAVVDLPRIPLTTGESGDAGESESAFSTGHVADVLVREYRTGDDLRRVHWRSTARTGELMVRREEMPRQATAVVLLETRARVHTGRGPDSSLERAVQATASVCHHLTHRGYDVRLLTPDGVVPLSRGHDPRRQMPEVLRALAVLMPSVRDTWAPPAAALWDLGRAIGPVVAVVEDPEGLDWTTTLPMRSGSPIAVIPESASEVLVRRGWRPVVWHHGTPLDVAWRGLDR